MSARFVGARAHGAGSVYDHAVFVPHDLPQHSFPSVQRQGRLPLHYSGRWRAQAECGQWISRVIAGPQGGHDWDRISDNNKCRRCVRAIARNSQTD